MQTCPNRFQQPESAHLVLFDVLLDSLQTTASLHLHGQWQPLLDPGLKRIQGEGQGENASQDPCIPTKPTATCTGSKALCCQRAYSHVWPPLWTMPHLTSRTQARLVPISGLEFLSCSLSKLMCTLSSHLSADTPSSRKPSLTSDLDLLPPLGSHSPLTSPHPSSNHPVAIWGQTSLFPPLDSEPFVGRKAVCLGHPYDSSIFQAQGGGENDKTH